MKQSFNLSNSVHRSIKNIQDRAERQSGQESVQRGGNLCALLGTAGEGTGARAAGQEHARGPCPVKNGKRTAVQWNMCERLCTGSALTCFSLSLWCVLSVVSRVPVSAAVRAQDEDGAEGSTGRTDTSSSVSITNSISSCEVTKIVRKPFAV